MLIERFVGFLGRRRGIIVIDFHNLLLRALTGVVRWHKCRRLAFFQNITHRAAGVKHGCHHWMLQLLQTLGHVSVVDFLVCRGEVKLLLGLCLATLELMLACVSTLLLPTGCMVRVSLLALDELLKEGESLLLASFGWRLVTPVLHFLLLEICIVCSLIRD